MKGYWTQPSLSRDFALLAAAILFILLLISSWVTYTTYTRHAQNIAADLEKEATRIERTLAVQMEGANYLLTALGRQIVLEPDRDLTKLAQILKSFDSKNYIYTVFSWDNPQQQVVVSSNHGVLEKPIDVSDRDYVKKALADPWKMAIGRPIEGRVSGRWVIPVAMGLTDYTGKFIGTIQISLDINSLTDQLTTLVKRDGISFAVVSKTLIPLTQMSDDKDFINDNFPAQKLVNVNFSKNPSGLLSEGSLFWGTGSYTYYRASQDYPFVVLLGYDTRYSDENMRGMLWSRLLQVMAMALFFVLFLWIVRARMIRPVMEMTSITSNVAQGQSFAPLSQGGPIEIEALAAQIKRVGDYIAENKRIEDELRNKMFMLKKAKERAEIDKRSASEFLAFMCQEMQGALNNIIGFAQVMKDQLYGPIENRKYRQYAADIYSAGNTLLENVQEMHTLAKAQTDYIELHEKPVDISGVVNKSLRFLADKMQMERLGVKTKLYEPTPRLIVDEFRLQQILMNLLLYALAHVLPEGTVLLEARVVNENKDKQFFAFVISSADRSLSSPELLAIAEQAMFSPSYRSPHRAISSGDDRMQLSVELARTLLGLHHGALDIIHSTDGTVTIVVMFGSNRIRFMDVG